MEILIWVCLSLSRGWWWRVLKVCCSSSSTLDADNVNTPTSCFYCLFFLLFVKLHQEVKFQNWFRFLFGAHLICQPNFVQAVPFQLCFDRLNSCACRFGFFQWFSNFALTSDPWVPPWYVAIESGILAWNIDILYGILSDKYVLHSIWHSILTCYLTFILT